jgi:hypothetical protein
VTVTCALPLAVPAVAVIVTGPPAATPVTTPADDTVAIAEFDVVQLVTRFVQFVCVTVALRLPVVPATTLSVAGVTTTAVTEHCGGVTEGPSLPPHPKAAKVTRARIIRGEGSLGANAMRGGKLTDFYS